MRGGGGVCQQPFQASQAQLFQSLRWNPRVGGKGRKATSCSKEVAHTEEVYSAGQRRQRETQNVFASDVLMFVRRFCDATGTDKQFLG